MKPDVVVVGAGAGGIVAAWRAAQLGAKVVLLEKTMRIGTKILISGGGKCNLTQAGDIEDVLRGFRPVEARFLRSAFYRFRNDQVVRLLESKGLRVYTRPDGRIFPVDQTAKDVVAMLAELLAEAGVEVRLNCPVTSLLVEDHRVAGVRYGRSEAAPAGTRDGRESYRPRTAKNLLGELDRVAIAEEGTGELFASRIIVSTGGSSYPNSGTTGEGWGWAKTLGHRIVRLRAALAPIYLEAVGDFAGISLRDIVLKARQGKEVARWRGDLLFTHQGISGPAALGVSRLVAEHMEAGKVSLEVDLRPDLSPEASAAQLSAFVSGNPHRRVAGFLDDIPERLVAGVLATAGIPFDAMNSRLDKKARNRLGETIRGWDLGVVRHVPLEKGEVVAGGVSLEEVDPKTMASRIVPGLFLCGEVLDVAGPVGGYNLQAAFSTGYVAGESAAKSLSD